jgi:enediyne biosynthesis protein E4
MPRLSSLLLLAALLVGAGTSLGGARTDRTIGASGAPAQSCDPQPVVPIGQAFFSDISARSGIQDENFDPANAVVANDHTRVAFVDLNGDGWDDVVMHNLAQIDNQTKPKPFEHLVFLNNGDGTFRNISDASGLRDIQAAFFAFADVDNDGDQDCFAGLDADRRDPPPLSHQLLLNDGQGHFTVKASSGIEARGTPHRAAIALFADYNEDGTLDLFLGNGSTSALMVDQLFFGRGDGTFGEATANLQGTASIMRLTNGGVSCDYDNDGDLDIFVSVYGADASADYAHNVLWENDGHGRFTNVARERGFEALATGNYALSTTGYGRNAEAVPQAQWMGGNGFGMQCEDANNDGLMDIWIANISHPVDSDYNRKWSDPSQLLINQGPAAGYAFKNVYLDAKIPFNEGDLGGSMADFDNDGLMDLAMSRESKYEFQYMTVEQHSWFGLFHQNLDGTFESVGLKSGINDLKDPAPREHQRAKASGSHAWSDIDHDGDLDLLVGTMQRVADRGRPNYLLRNDIGSRNAWLAVRLENPTGAFNRDAIGTRVELVYPDRVLMRELKGNRGMDNSDDTRVLHFGLGNLGCATSVRVRWPNDEVVTFDGRSIGQNRYVVLRYGEGEPVPPTPTPTDTPHPIVVPTDEPTATPWPVSTPVPEGRVIYLPVAARGARLVTVSREETRVE